MNQRIQRVTSWLIILLVSALGTSWVAAAEGQFRGEVATAMRKAASFYHGKVAAHGGYVYHYSLDLARRWGEGEATADQIWVQPPGTPTVGLAYLRAYEATKEPFYLQAAKDAAEAIVYGQLQGGGWTNSIDFNPRGERVALYRNGKGRGKNNSTLDDGISQSAIRFLIHMDRALEFNDKPIHDSAQFALDALLKAQFPNGAFPQVWTGPVASQPTAKASFPDYDWRTEGRIKNYWDMYNLNDNIASHLTVMLSDAGRIYRDDRYKKALARLGDFLILAQMPDPQPAWAQQYDYAMHPIWARRFEPPAVTGGESQDVLESLVEIYRATGDRKYLEPVPKALEYLKRSLLPDGRLARYYELRTNKPLYMTRRGDTYSLTYDDSDLPDHYGWMVDSRLDDIELRFRAASGGIAGFELMDPARILEPEVRRILAKLDDDSRWVSTYLATDGPLVGQPKFPQGFQYLSSEVFSRNLTTLSEYLKATQPSKGK